MNAINFVRVSDRALTEFKDNSKCSVCLEHVEKDGMAHDFTHIFHEHCVTPWLQDKHTCPNCRAPVTTQRTSRNQNNAVGQPNHNVIQPLLPARAPARVHAITTILLRQLSVVPTYTHLQEEDLTFGIAIEAPFRFIAGMFLGVIGGLIGTIVHFYKMFAEPNLAKEHFESLIVDFLRFATGGLFTAFNVAFNPHKYHEGYRSPHNIPLALSEAIAPIRSLPTAVFTAFAYALVFPVIVYCIESCLN